MAPNSRVCMASIVTALIVAVLCVRFSSSYFSYALILALIFLVYSFVVDRTRWTNTFSSWEIDKNFWIGAILFYGLTAAAGAAWGDWKSVALATDYAGLFLPCLILFVLRRQYIVDVGVKYGFLMGGLIFGAWGCMQWYMEPSHRIDSFFPHPNALGTGIILLLPFLGYWAFKSANIKERVCMILVMALLLFDLYHTESRGAMMGLGIGIAGSAIFGLSLYWHRISAKWRVGVTVLAVCAFLAGAMMVHNVSAERTGTGKIGGERLLMLETSYHMWDDHKWLGVGLANWETMYYSDAYHPKEGREQGLGMPHNMPVYFFSTTGIVGGLGYCAFLLISFWTILKKSKEDQSKGLSLAMMAVFLGFTAQSMVDATIINKIPARIYFALWGYYLARTAASSLDSDKGHSLSS